MIPNAALRDPRLSYAARGVLAEILSHPDDWQTSAAAMARQAAKVGEGRYGMAAIFRELKAAGYVQYEVTRGPGGRFATHVHIYDVPSTAGDDVSAGRAGNRSTAGRSAGRPATGRRPAGKPPADSTGSRGSSRRLSTKTEDQNGSDQNVISGAGSDGATPPGGDDDLIRIALDELAASGRKTVTPEAAAEIVRQVLAGRTVAPAARGAYVARAIRESPGKYLPAKSAHPPRFRGGKFIE